MALKREYLKGMGLTDEQVSAIIDAHAETVEALKQQRDQYKADAEKLTTVQKELDTIKSGKDWKAEFDKEHKAFEDYKSEIATRDARAAKQSALRSIAKDANLSEAGIEKALKYTDYSTFELDADGKVKDAKSLIDAIQTEWSGYIMTAENRGAVVETTPGSGQKPTREDIYRRDEHGRYIMSTAERQKALAEMLQK